MMTNINFGTDAHYLSRTGGASTSQAAAESINTTRLETMVYRAIYNCKQDGCIADDLLAQFPAFAYSSITARFAALERKGFITCGPDTRTGKSGRQQRVMRFREKE